MHWTLLPWRTKLNFSASATCLVIPLTCKHFNASLAHATWHLTQYPAFTAIVQWIVCPSGGFYLLFEIPYVFCCGVGGGGLSCIPQCPFFAKPPLPTPPHTLPPQHAPDLHEPTVDVYLHLVNVTLSSTHACALARRLATLWRHFKTRVHTRVRTDNPTDICHDSLYDVSLHNARNRERCAPSSCQAYKRNVTYFKGHNMVSPLSGASWPSNPHPSMHSGRLKTRRQCHVAEFFSK